MWSDVGIYISTFKIQHGEVWSHNVLKSLTTFFMLMNLKFTFVAKGQCAGAFSTILLSKTLTSVYGKSHFFSYELCQLRAAVSHDVLNASSKVKQ